MYLNNSAPRCCDVAIGKLAGLRFGERHQFRHGFDRQLGRNGEHVHLVVLDARGTASVTRYGHAGVEQICSGPAKANRLKMIPPLIATVISSDGRGTSAKIEIVAARGVMQ
jgi:hypothetical protein